MPSRHITCRTVAFMARVIYHRIHSFVRAIRHVSSSKKCCVQKKLCSRYLVYSKSKTPYVYRLGGRFIPIIFFSKNFEKPQRATLTRGEVRIQIEIGAFYLVNIKFSNAVGEKNVNTGGAAGVFLENYLQNFIRSSGYK